MRKAGGRSLHIRIGGNDMDIEIVGLQDLVNVIYKQGYNKAIDDAKSVILQTLDNKILVDTLHLRLEQLKAGESE